MSDEIKADNQVKGVAATAGDGEITLVWEALPNVTGYTVAYGTEKDRLDRTAGANTNRIVISDLENSKTYYFQVTAVSGDWSGTPSAVLSAMPLPAAVPGAPSNIVVENATAPCACPGARPRTPLLPGVLSGEGRGAVPGLGEQHRLSGRGDHRPDQRHRVRGGREGGQPPRHRPHVRRGSGHAGQGGL